LKEKTFEPHHLLSPEPTDTINALLNYKKQKGLPTVTRHKMSKILREDACRPYISKKVNGSQMRTKLPEINVQTAKSGSVSALRLGFIEKEKAQSSLCESFEIVFLCITFKI